MRTLTTVLVVAVGALVALSLTMLTSATMLEGSANAGLRSQAAAAAVGFIALVGVSMIDYHRLQSSVWWIYAATLLLLVMVLSPLGHETKGAQRWLFGVQPSEVAKLSLIVVLAWHGARNQGRMDRFVPGIVVGAGLAVPMIALILRQPDRGTAALMMLLTILLLLVAGARWWYVAPPMVLFGAALAAMIVFSPMARNRVDAWLNPASHKDGAAQQARKGLFAFGEGGWEGRGLGRGSLKYTVPEVHTDFILPAVGEELGLPFTIGITAAYGVILFCGLGIARRAPDTFGLLLAAGVTFLIAAQACINIGVVTTVLPNKGMPLPFVSRGGTSLSVLLAMVGVLVAVARQASPDAPARRARGRDPFSPDTDFAGAA